MADARQDIRDLRDRIESLSPADRLRFAAAILDNADRLPREHRVGQVRLAHSVASKVAAELGTVLAMRAAEELRRG